MNNSISSWLRRGAVSLALVCLAGSALAQRTVTSSSSGGTGRDAIDSGNLNVCAVDDFRGKADACSGFFSPAFSGVNYGTEIELVQALVTDYDLNKPNVFWGTSHTRVDSKVSGNNASTNSLFTTSVSGIFGEVRFKQDLTGSFVVVLSGTWDPPRPVSVNNPPRLDWSAYYLYDDVAVETYNPFDSSGAKFLSFSLYGADLPLDAQVNTLNPRFDAYVMQGLSVDKVSIYQFDTTRTANVPEPSSLLLSGLALGALGAAAASVRRRRLCTGTARAL